MATWNPQDYLKFESERLRPALDLMERIPAVTPETIIDLGCGAGNVTAALAGRWPDAALAGVDTSKPMLDAARNSGLDAEWIEADLRSWAPQNPVDLIFSNAVMHWVGGHEIQFPRLLSFLKPGGVLAIQMPDNFNEPTHTSIEDVVFEGTWRGDLEPSLIGRPVWAVEDYYDLMAPLSTKVDFWRTNYIHVLEGDNPVVEYTSGSALRPFLDRLEGSHKDDFLNAYSQLIRDAYPPQADGKTLLAMKRLFMVITR